MERYEKHISSRKAGIERICQVLQERENAGILEKSCMKLGIPYGIFDRLRKAGLGTIGDFQDVMKKPGWQKSVAGVGRKQADVIVCRMLDMGLASEDCATVREYRQRKNTA